MVTESDFRKQVYIQRNYHPKKCTLASVCRQKKIDYQGKLKLPIQRNYHMVFIIYQYNYKNTIHHAHSIIYDVPSNSFRPLFVQTNAWCSSGVVDGVEPEV